MILYHTDLVRQDIYREPFTRWSPSPVEKTRPGSTVAKLPCLAYNGVIQLFPNNIWFDKTTELEVVIEYEKASKPRWYVIISSTHIHAAYTDDTLIYSFRRVILFTEKQMLAMYSALNKWIMNDMPKPSALKSDSDRVG